jgi:hypothetical protein
VFGTDIGYKATCWRTASGWLTTFVSSGRRRRVRLAGEGVLLTESSLRQRASMWDRCLLWPTIVCAEWQAGLNENPEAIGEGSNMRHSCHGQDLKRFLMI